MGISRQVYGRVMKSINNINLLITPIHRLYPDASFGMEAVQYELTCHVDGQVAKSVRIMKQIEANESELEHFARLLTAQLYEAYQLASVNPIDKWDKALDEIQHKTTHKRI